LPTSSPGACKIVFYPAEVSATGCVLGNTIAIEVPLSNGFGTGRPINGTTLYNVTAFSGGRNSADDIYADADSTRSFDYTLGNISGPLVSVASRKVHSGAGTFDINLPLTGTRGVECRGSGSTNDYALVFTFANNLTSVAGATVSAHDPASGTGTVVGSPIVSGNQVTVNLTGVSTGQYLTVTLNGVSGVACNTGDIVGPQMGVLVGDVNADGQVDSSDLIKVKQQTLQPVNDDPGTSNFREDVNFDGNIDSGDLLITKGKTLTGLPSAP
jgi:Dockerin type I domain